MSVSSEVVIMTVRELDDLKRAEFKRGVERGRFEEGARHSAKEYGRVAATCAHWGDGRCEMCGVQWQYFEVNAEFPCPHWRERR